MNGDALGDFAAREMFRACLFCVIVGMLIGTVAVVVWLLGLLGHKIAGGDIDELRRRLFDDALLARIAAPVAPDEEAR